MWNIVHITLQEYRRNNILRGFLLVGICLVWGGGYITSHLVIQDSSLVLFNFVLTFHEFLLGIVLCFLMSYSIYHDIQRKTALLLYTKGLSSLSYIRGKYISFVLMLVVMFMVFTCIYTLIYRGWGYSISLQAYIAIIGSMIKLLVIVAWVLFLACAFSPLFAFSMGVGIYIVGHLFGFVLFSLQHTDNLFYYIVYGISYIFPGLDLLTVSVHRSMTTGWIDVFWIATLVHIVYSAVIVYGAVLVSHRYKIYTTLKR